MAEIVVPLVLAIIQGKESKLSLNLSHALFIAYYDSAYELYINNFIALPTMNGYKVVKHSAMWTRRVR